MCELYFEFACFVIYYTYSIVLVTLVIQTDSFSHKWLPSNTHLHRLLTESIITWLQDGTIVPMYVATFLDTWKIGIAVECEADRERELTGRLPRHCLAEHLSTSHLATAVWLLPVLLQSA